jgi:hypothetical protein
LGGTPARAAVGVVEVWRAYDTATDRVVKLKVLAASLANDQVFQHRPEAK